MKRSFLSVTAVALSLFTLNSCSKKNDDPGPYKGKTVKFTLSVENFKPEEDADFLSVVIVGVDLQNTKTLWKVNGTVRNNEQTVSFTEAELKAGGPYVVESVVPLNVITAGIQAINFGGPFTVKFEPVIDGKALDPFNETVSDSFDKDWSY